jgi:adenylate kinase
MFVDDEVLVASITARSTCGMCGEVYNDITKPIPADGKCENCGSTEFTRRADDNEESLRTRLMAYYKQTSPLIGYYYAKGELSSVNGLGEIDEVASEIKSVLG